MTSPSQDSAHDTLGRVVVLEDEPAMLRIVTRALLAAGYDVVGFDRVGPGLDEILRAPPDVVLTDVHLPDGSGRDVLTKVRAHWPAVTVVLMTGMATIDEAVDAIRSGAHDYLVKPLVHTDVAVTAVARAMEHSRVLSRNAYLESRLVLSERFQNIVGDSKRMRDVFALIEGVAPVDTTVLVLGESGTGKELVVRAIHDRSRRSAKRFVAINCGALTESVLESELFGHARGAFTGAVSARRGLFEEATGGTIFLDEVGELPLATQVRLLRVLQEHEVRPVGSNEARKVDARVLAATHRDLAKEVEKGRFREDLFYRLNVISIQMPPLRDRREDIPLLVHHFLRKHAARLGKNVSRIDPAALDRLAAHDYPGNARELENLVERAVVLTSADVISLDSLPAQLGPRSETPSVPADVVGLPLVEAKDLFEQRYLRAALLQAAGSVSAAARLAGLDRSNFRRLMKRHRIEANLFKDDAAD